MSYMGVGAQALGLFSTVLASALADGWIRSEAARAQPEEDAGMADSSLTGFAKVPIPDVTLFVSF